MEILKVTGLGKSYGSIKALNDLNMSVEAGQIYGILGPNGSGKTTTLGILTGALYQDAGQYTWFQNKHKNPLTRIGTILETPNFFPYLNASENLDIVRHIKKSSDSNFDEILKLVNLYDRRNSKFATYSLGMKQRLAIAATMVGSPDVLIFDEPTNGLDPQGIADVRMTLQKVASSGKTVLLASHILDEVEKICSDVAIIKNGKLLAQGPVGSILSSDKTIEINATDNDRLKTWLTESPIINKYHKGERFYECSVEEDLDIGQVSKALSDHQIYVTHLVERKQRLEEEFLQITANV